MPVLNYLCFFFLECKLKEGRDFVLFKVTHIQLIKSSANLIPEAYTVEQWYNASYGLIQDLEPSHNQDYKEFFFSPKQNLVTDMKSLK